MNGVMLGLTGPPAWDWGDGTTSQAWFGVTHTYKQNGIYKVAVTGTTSSGLISESVAVTVTNAEDPVCSIAVRVVPEIVSLRDGHTSEPLRVQLRDAAGKWLPLSGRVVTFTSSAPSVVVADGTGTVSSAGFGQADVTVQVGGLPRTATAHVYAGHFRLRPSLMILTPGSTGQIQLDVTNADGSAVNLTGRNLQFQGGNQVASVTASGLVTGLRPPQLFGETPYINASLDGIGASNATVVRVLSAPLGRSMTRLEQPHVVFDILEGYLNVDYQDLFRRFDVARLTEHAYLMETELSGLKPFKGDVQHLANDPAPLATAPCGLSGNPVRLGTSIDRSIHNSCLIVAYPPESPQWGVFFHEMGHNFSFASGKFGQFVGVQSSAAYSEGLASVLDMYAGERLRQKQADLGIPQDVMSNILSSVGWNPVVAPYSRPQRLEAYVAGGANYASLTADVVDDMVMVLIEDYGLRSLYRFWSVFLPANEGYRFTFPSTAVAQATLFASAWSAATGTDLRARFRGWGFPIDDGYYAATYADVNALVSQRDPGAYAGRNRQMNPGDSLVLEDAEAFAWDGAPVVEWKISGSPAGSQPRLSSTTQLHPSFTAERMGTYLLEMNVRDGMMANASSAVIVYVLPPSQAGCTYTLNVGGQAFPASGGTGAIDIATSSDCFWTVTSQVDWVSLTSGSSGTGSGRVTYRVTANSGAARSGTLAISGLSFIVEQVAGITTGLNVAGSMGQLASGGYWTSTITLVNTGTAAAQARLNFFDDAGNPLLLPVTFPQSSSSGTLLASTIDRTLTAGAALVLQSTGPDVQQALQGWAQLLTSGAVTGFAVFRQQIGANGWEAVVPLENRNARTYALWFDQMNGMVIGVAVANQTQQAVTVGVAVRDDGGATIGSTSFSVPASGHAAFPLSDRFAVTAQRRGTVEFSTPSAGQISVLGLSFNPLGGFSTIPPFAK